MYAIRSYYGLLKDLHANEEQYTELIYAKIGLVDEVKTFLSYNFV